MAILTQSKEVLIKSAATRQEIRDFARLKGIPLGWDTQGTINNLREAGFSIFDVAKNKMKKY